MFNDLDMFEELDNELTVWATAENDDQLDNSYVSCLLVPACLIERTRSTCA